MKPADWLRDYLSKYGSEMDAEEYDGLAACLRALDEATAIVAAEREACFQCAVCEAEWATGEYAMACENIQQAIRARGEAPAPDDYQKRAAAAFARDYKEGA